jgi:hypothetical protein
MCTGLMVVNEWVGMVGILYQASLYKESTSLFGDYYCLERWGEKDIKYNFQISMSYLFQFFVSYMYMYIYR